MLSLKYINIKSHWKMHTWNINYHNVIIVIINFYINYILKGNFPLTTMWIGFWVESNFTNPTVKVWADLDNLFKRSDYAKLCMSPSLDGTPPEYVISQEDNSPLNLYIDFHNCLIFLGYQ